MLQTRFTKEFQNQAVRLVLTSGRSEQSGTKHQLTKVNHPQASGQVERTNRTIREAIGSATTTARMISLGLPAALHGRLQSCSKAQGPERPHALRVRLPPLNQRARTVQDQPVIPHPGTIRQ
jgi:hypothetical protein